MRGGLEQFVENADTEAPRFLTMVDGHRNSPVKLGLDNPSNVYSTARVRGTADYVVRGHRGTVAILSFGYQVCGLWRYATTRLCVADSMSVWLCVFGSEWLAVCACVGRQLRRARWPVHCGHTQR